MADALCGPSNALQSFRKHTQLDRTLQQDRLSGARFSPGQGFRSHDPRAGSLDADFHAFENAAPHPFQFHDPLLSQPQFINAPVHNAQLSSPNWTTDFQNLHLSDQPLPAQQFRTEAPLIRSTNAGWHNEFMRQREGGVSSIAQGKQVAFEQPQMTGFPMGNQMQFPGGFSQQYDSHLQEMTQSSQMQDQSVDQISGDNWAEAFRDAFEDAQQFEEISTAHQTDMLHQDGTYTNDHSEMVETEPLQPEDIKIGSDAIEYTETKDRSIEQDSHDASALARVAGELLHNVQHENNEKFQNSQFLDLMRKIRDRQVEVRNNDFEHAEGGSVMSNGPQNTISKTEQMILAQKDPEQTGDSFQFPDLNAVYEPDPAMDMTDYTFDSDQFPAQPQSFRNQMSDLHPGGKYYPEQSPPTSSTEMSGAVSASRISADDFESIDESRDFAGRYRRPDVEAQKTTMA